MTTPNTANRMFRQKHFKLGTFSTNCSGGMTVTKIPERWDATWDSNLAVARLLDEAGIDFMLPIARWIGYGGETNFHGYVLETMTWAAALLASTQRITVFATMHTAVNHPVVIAKQIATIDQVGKGRAGLNIVAGWNKPEYEALGGRFWNLKDVHSDPKPFAGQPPIINAAGSGQGREFATDNANFLFTPAIDLNRTVEEVAELKQQAARKGREVDVLTFSHVVCRPTEKEARDYVDYFFGKNTDWAATDNLVRLQFAHAHSFPHDLLALIRDRMAMGHGGFPLIGTPEQVADGICQLHEAGLGGTTLSFVDYTKEFPYFRDNVLPILEARGLRQPG